MIKCPFSTVMQSLCMQPLVCVYLDIPNYNCQRFVPHHQTGPSPRLCKEHLGISYTSLSFHAATHISGIGKTQNRAGRVHWSWLKRGNEINTVWTLCHVKSIGRDMKANISVAKNGDIYNGYITVVFLHKL